MLHTTSLLPTIDMDFLKFFLLLLSANFLYQQKVFAKLPSALRPRTRSDFIFIVFVLDLSSVPGSRKRFDTTRRAFKRKRGSSREPRSVPVSGEPSRHGPQSQVNATCSIHLGTHSLSTHLYTHVCTNRDSFAFLLFHTLTFHFIQSTFFEA